MKKSLLLASVAVAGLTSAASAADLKVCVSWSNFREERWKTDEAAIKGTLDAAGAEYISADAQTSASKQLADIEGMITQGCSALIILAQDSASIGPALDAAADAGIPVVGYDRMIDDPRAFYLTFDNVEVGRMQAAEVLKVAPKGRYVMIKGSPVDPNADFLRVAQGTQTVSVWKDSRALGKAAGEIAVALASGTAMADVPGAAAFKSPGGKDLTSVLLKPVPVTKDNLNVVLDAGWITKDALCAGVSGVAVCE